MIEILLTLMDFVLNLFSYGWWGKWQGERRVSYRSNVVFIKKLK